MQISYRVTLPTELAKHKMEKVGFFVAVGPRVGVRVRARLKGKGKGKGKGQG